ncbi:hypothetical protein LP417_18275 [Polaromonas sp. P1-6]|nr:hypothetical protein LP417_18275 [Polaromonas sp. P1-6]
MSASVRPGGSTITPSASATKRARCEGDTSESKRNVKLATRAETGTTRNCSERFHADVHLVDLRTVANHTIDHYTGPTVAYCQSRHEVAEDGMPREATGVDHKNLPIPRLVHQISQHIGTLLDVHGSNVSREGLLFAEGDEGPFADLNVFARIAKISGFDVHGAIR